ncbi:hypothetical protein [Blastomonas aquatica]|nr:hypothetical protein [Blastomonas aquatica]
MADVAHLGGGEQVMGLDLVLEFEIEKGRSPDLESVARALLAWNDAVQAACAAISPSVKVVVELAGVEHGS